MRIALKKLLSQKKIWFILIKVHADRWSRPTVLKAVWAGFFVASKRIPFQMCNSWKLLTTNYNRGNMYEVNENIISINDGGLEYDFIGRYSGNGICC